MRRGRLLLIAIGAFLFAFFCATLICRGKTNDAPRIVEVGIVPYLDLEMVDTNALYTLWRSVGEDGLVSNRWAKTGMHDYRPTIPCTNRFWEASDHPPVQFYKLTKRPIVEEATIQLWGGLPSTNSIAPPPGDPPPMPGGNVSN